MPDLSSSQVTLRPAQAADAEFLLAVYASTRAEEMALVPWSDDQRAQFLHMQFTAQLQHYQKHYPKATHDLVLLGGHPIGRLYVDCSADDEICLLDLTLLPEYRGSGLGTPLLRQLQSEAAASARRLTIHLEVNNRARRLFERLGFAPVPGEEQGFHIPYEWRASTT